MNLSVIVITYNEEVNLPACLESLKGLDCEILVVDSGSTDRTREIAEQYGAKHSEHAFETHAKQWSWALQNLPLSTEWILGLDADQRLTAELREEIVGLFNRETLEVRRERLGVRGEEKTADVRHETLVEQQGEKLDGINGFYIKRRQVFRGKWIRHGGYYPKYLLKLFRRDKVRIDVNDLMDHHFYVQGPVAKLQHDIIEQNEKENDISFWIEKHNGYATLMAREQLLRNGDNLRGSLVPSLIGNPDQRTLWLKGVLSRLPLYVRPFLYFSYRYFLRLGFLDGKEGFIFHFLQGFWFRLLVDIKLDELRREQKSEVGDQRSEIGGQKSEVRSQRSEVRGRKSEDRRQA